MPDDRHDHHHDPAHDPAHDHGADAGPGGPPAIRCACCNPDAPPPGGDETFSDDPAAHSLARALSTSFALLKGLMLFLLVFFLFSCVTFVKQGKVGLIRRFGDYLKDGDGAVRKFQPGRIVFVWPAPIESFEEIALEENKKISLDTEFWPVNDKRQALDPDARELQPQESLDPQKDGYHLTGDMNILHSRWTVEYNIVDPVHYRLGVADMLTPSDLDAPDTKLTPEDFLRATVRDVILRNLAGSPVEVLYRDAGTLYDRINTDAKNAMCDSAGQPLWGIKINMISNVRLVPPGKTQTAFNAAFGAVTERQKMEDDARGEANVLLREADTEAHKIVTDAEAYRRRVVDKADGDARRLADLLARFPNDPEGCRLFLRQYRYENLRDILKTANTALLRPGQNWYLLAPPEPSAFAGDAKEEKK